MEDDRHQRRMPVVVAPGPRLPELRPRVERHQGRKEDPPDHQRGAGYEDERDHLREASHEISQEIATHSTINVDGYMNRKSCVGVAAR